MSPPAATASQPRRRNPRPAPARRRAAARRRLRRLITAAVLLGIVAVAVVLMLPLAKRAVNDLGLPIAYQGDIRAQAHEKHLDPALVAAVIYAETKFIPRTSSAGAEGLMQLMPQTATYLAHQSGGTTFTVKDLGTPSVNIAYGSYYLRYLLDHFHNNKMLAIAAYNGGIANVDHWIADARSAGHRLTISGIPFPETRAYVEKVLAAQHEYRTTYASQLGYG